MEIAQDEPSTIQCSVDEVVAKDGTFSRLRICSETTLKCHCGWKLKAEVAEATATDTLEIQVI